VVDLPTDPIGFLSAIRATMALDRPRLLQEDRQRASMYRNELQRQRLRKSITTLEDFLIGLEMSARMGRCGPATIDRIHQLIAKTNQFNLTSRRYSLDQIKSFMKSPEHEVVWMRLADRYGDMGLICVGIVSKVDVHLWEIDAFLMSCRVMGRNVEMTFLSYLAEVAAEHGAKRLRGLYRKTAKNTPVQTFYPDCGFIEVGRNENEEWLYEKDITADGFKWPKVIERQDNAE
jgi:FkbH-like protein